MWNDAGVRRQSPLSNLPYAASIRPLAGLATPRYSALTLIDG